MKISRTGQTAQMPKADKLGALAMNKEQQAMLKNLIKAEKKAAPQAFAAAATRSARSADEVVPGNIGDIVAMYVAPDFPVARYIMPMPPEWSIDAHQALINKITTDKKVTVKEARLIKMLFNYDIDFAAGEGKEIGRTVTNFLQVALRDVDMSKTAKKLIFGPGGPGSHQRRW